MSFVTDAVGKVVGGVQDMFGARNKFDAQAPANSFQATQAPLDKSAYAAAIREALAAAGGGGANAQGQSGLIGLLQAAANGQGPSPAVEQLHQATDANAQRAAGSIASTRGLNPALAARLAADTAGNVNQQAAGQAATLKAQEQVAARSDLAQALQAQRGQDLSLLGTAGGLQNQQNTGIIQNSLGAQGLNQGVAAQNANLALGAEQINAGVAAQNANTGAGIMGGAMQGGGAALGLAEGGEVPTRAELAAALKVHRYASGGAIEIPQITVPDYGAAMYSRGGTSIRDALTPGKKKDKEEAAPEDPGPSNPFVDAEPIAAAPIPFARGGQVNEFARAIAARGLHDFRAGGPIPGRADVAGDSERNDTVPIMGSPGEIVLPRSVAQAPDAAQRAAEFVAAIKARSEPRGGYGKVLAARRAFAAQRASVAA